MPHDIIILTVGTVIGVFVALVGCLFNRRFVSEENAERIIELEVRLADMQESRDYYREAVEHKRGNDRAAAVKPFYPQPYQTPCNQKEPNNYGP